VLKTGKKFNLDQNVVALLKQWNMADFQLYAHFQCRFWKQVLREGVDVFLEVQHFKLINKQAKEYCTQLQTAKLTTRTVSSETIRSSRWNDEFTITSRDCEIMLMDELPMMKWLITDAHKRNT
jgi:hypothetical protein